MLHIDGKTYISYCINFSLDCTNGELVGNGKCNDETNNLNCAYDGGDCCGSPINTNHCSNCTCHHKETCASGVAHPLVGNDICNDETNVEECDFDGGDCCGSCINVNHCSQCICYETSLNDLSCKYYNWNLNMILKESNRCRKPMFLTY